MLCCAVLDELARRDGMGRTANKGEDKNKNTGDRPNRVP